MQLSFKIFKIITKPNEKNYYVLILLEVICLQKSMRFCDFIIINLYAEMAEMQDGFINPLNQQKIHNYQISVQSLLDKRIFCMTIRSISVEIIFKSTAFIINKFDSNQIRKMQMHLFAYGISQNSIISFLWLFLYCEFNSYFPSHLCKKNFNF